MKATVSPSYTENPVKREVNSEGLLILALIVPIRPGLHCTKNRKY